MFLFFENKKEVTFIESSLFFNHNLSSCSSDNNEFSDSKNLVEKNKKTIYIFVFLNI